MTIEKLEPRTQWYPAGDQLNILDTDGFQFTENSEIAVYVRDQATAGGDFFKEIDRDDTPTHFGQDATAISIASQEYILVDAAGKVTDTQRTSPKATQVWLNPANPAGSSWTFITPAFTGVVDISIFRETPQVQDHDFLEGDKYYAENNEEVADQAVQSIQELEYRADRSFQFDLAFDPTGDQTKLPRPDGDQFIKWNFDGTELENAESFTVKVSENDQTNDFLEQKVSATHPIEVASDGNFPDEKLNISLDLQPGTGLRHEQLNGTGNLNHEDIIITADAPLTGGANPIDASFSIGLDQSGIDHNNIANNGGSIHVDHATTNLVPGDAITVDGGKASVDTTVDRTIAVNITGQPAILTVDPTDELLIHDASGSTINKVQVQDLSAAVGDVKDVLVSSNDLTSDFLSSKIEAAVGTNPSDALEASIETPADFESTDFDFAGLTGAALAGFFVTINSANDATQYYAWFNTGADLDPAPGGTGIQVNVNAVDADTVVATAFAAALDSNPDFSAPVPAGTIANVTNTAVGTTTDATQGTTAVAVTVLPSNEVLRITFDESKLTPTTNTFATVEVDTAAVTTSAPNIDFPSSDFTLTVSDPNVDVAIANNAITNAKAADMPALTIKGNNTGAPADPIDLTGSQVVTVVVSESGGGTTNFLRADGSWDAPAGGGGGSRHIIQDEGSAETDRPALNFIGAAVDVQDDGLNNRTNVTITIPSGSSAPVGTISPYGGTTAPTGWLLCDGSSHPVTSFTNLWDVIGNNFGGNGTNIPVYSGSFNVPDLRGQFIRGVDGGAGNDPDAAGRTASAAGGNTGDNVGSRQDDQFKSHQHTYTQPFGNSVNSVAIGTNGPSQTLTGATGGAETRPKNIYVNFIIKAQDISGDFASMGDRPIWKLTGNLGAFDFFDGYYMPNTSGTFAELRAATLNSGTSGTTQLRIHRERLGVDTTFGPFSLTSGTNQPELDVQIISVDYEPNDLIWMEIVQAASGSNELTVQFDIAQPPPPPAAIETFDFIVKQSTSIDTLNKALDSAAPGQRIYVESHADIDGTTVLKQEIDLDNLYIEFGPGAIINRTATATIGLEISSNKTILVNANFSNWGNLPATDRGLVLTAASKNTIVRGGRFDSNSNGGFDDLGTNNSIDVILEVP